jgi:hypothetical protein
MARTAKRSARGSTQASRSMSPSKRARLETPLGREDDFDAADRDAIIDDEVRRPDIASHPRSEVTARHDEGSGANETIDGLDEYQEATRHGAEDVPDKRTTLKDIPVFDRAEVEPKV